MKTHALLTLSEADLVPLLREMKLKELDRHARKLVSLQGNDNFDHIMSQLIALIP